MRRASAYVLIPLLLLAGCGGTADGNDPATRTSAASPSSSSGASTLPAEPGATHVPDESNRPKGGDGGGGGGGGDEDERNIEIGGPTLDNTFPTNPFALPWPGGSSCVVFTNRTSDITVTVRSVRLVDQQPSDDPGLALGSRPSGHPQCRPGQGGVPEDLAVVHEDCIDAELEPAEATGCPVTVQSTGSVGTDYTALLVLQLEATCTTLTGEPCARLAGRAAPSAGDPVTVSWQDARRYSSCLVPRDRKSAEFLPEEGDGRCPVDGPSDPPPSDSPPNTDQEPGSGNEPGSDPPGPGDTGQPPKEDSDTEGTGPTPAPAAAPTAEGG